MKKDKLLINAIISVNFKSVILSGKNTDTKIIRCLISFKVNSKTAKIYWQERSVLVSRERYCEKRVDRKEAGKNTEEPWKCSWPWLWWWLYNYIYIHKKHIKVYTCYYLVLFYIFPQWSSQSKNYWAGKNLHTHSLASRNLWVLISKTHTWL